MSIPAPERQSMSAPKSQNGFTTYRRKIFDKAFGDQPKISRPEETEEQQKIQGYGDDQDLGSKIGHLRPVRVWCTFKAEESRWITEGATEASREGTNATREGLTVGGGGTSAPGGGTNSPAAGTNARGLLLFDISFDDHRTFPLQSVVVTVDVETLSSNISTPVVVQCAPECIVGEPIKQSVEKDKRVDPQLGAGGGGASLDLQGYAVDKKTAKTIDHRWSFEASRSARHGQTEIRTAGFNWQRTEVADIIAARRSYAGAFVVKGFDTTSLLTLKVRVKVYLWHGWLTFWKSQSAEKVSKPFGPCAKPESEQLVPGDDLNKWMNSKNDAMAPTEIRSVQHLRLPTKPSVINEDSSGAELSGPSHSFQETTSAANEGIKEIVDDRS